MAIDLFFVLMSTYGFYFGYTHGILRVLGIAVALIAGLLLSMYLTVPAIELFSTLFGINAKFLPLFTFGLVSIFIFLTAMLLLRIVRENTSIAKLGKTAKIIGAILMATIFVFLYSVLLLFFSQSNAIDSDKAREKSMFFPVLEKLPSGASGLIKSAFPFVNTFFLKINKSENDTKLEDDEKQGADDYQE